MRLAVILNATRGDTAALADHITSECRRLRVDVTIDVTDGASLAITARRALERGSTTVAAGGGDGTISAVASELTGTDVTLGVLPLGTLNHFARDLRIPHDMNQALATLLGTHTVRVDVGEVNGHTFINNSSVGLYPRLVWEREHRQRHGQRKWAAMAAATWTVWQHYRRVTVRVQPGHDRAERVLTPFVFVGNNTYELKGLEFGSRPRLDGGRLHVCMAPNLTAGDVMRVLGATLVGRLDSFDQFESLHTGELTIAAHRMQLGVALDGEVTVLPTPLHYRMHPLALRVAATPPD